jgi:uncharacterized protein YbjT (DUF2867 family)
LVTGATGFIGSSLVKELVREEHSVRALVLPGEDVPVKTRVPHEEEMQRIGEWVREM